ncbi:hypothetical protein CDAR_70861 [Caerostris darwini]|uniref:Uncharacterized protein n=1 Tax=Caerostris darwini TaxID=1538125 RepID=A0AAV4WFG1_9ARAC|nr:hypothetical protein CDAR_70861 [Caerostris darwini]
MKMGCYWDRVESSSTIAIVRRELWDNLVEAEPEFAEPIQNVTVATGRDAQLSCTVENLGTYRVGSYSMVHAMQ